MSPLNRLAAIVTVLAISSAALPASAQPIFLTCRLKNTSTINTMYDITIDKTLRHVTMSAPTNGAPVLDDQGLKLFPAEFSSSAITWEIDHFRSKGVRTYWTFDPLDDMATSHDVGLGAETGNTDSVYTCEAGKRPAPKF